MKTVHVIMIVTLIFGCTISESVNFNSLGNGWNPFNTNGQFIFPFAKYDNMNRQDTNIDIQEQSKTEQIQREQKLQPTIIKC
jgi:hypothetical protein